MYLSHSFSRIHTHIHNFRFPTRFGLWLDFVFLRCTAMVFLLNWFRCAFKPNAHFALETICTRYWCEFVWCAWSLFLSIEIAVLAIKSHLCAERGGIAWASEISSQPSMINGIVRNMHAIHQERSAEKLNWSLDWSCALSVCHKIFIWKMKENQRRLCKNQFNFRRKKWMRMFG